MQRKTAIGIGLGVAVGQFVSAVVLMSLVGGGGGGQGGTGSFRHTSCLIWLFIAQVYLLLILLVCTFDCDPVDPTKCNNRCVRNYLYGSLAVVTLAIACFTFG